MLTSHALCRSWWLQWSVLTALLTWPVYQGMNPGHWTPFLSFTPGAVSENFFNTHMAFYKSSYRPSERFLTLFAIYPLLQWYVPAHFLPPPPALSAWLMRHIVIAITNSDNRRHPSLAATISLLRGNLTPAAIKAYSYGSMVPRETWVHWSEKINIGMS